MPSQAVWHVLLLNAGLRGDHTCEKVLALPPFARLRLHSLSSSLARACPRNAFMLTPRTHSRHAHSCHEQLTPRTLMLPTSTSSSRHAHSYLLTPRAGVLTCGVSGKHRCDVLPLALAPSRWSAQSQPRQPGQAGAGSRTRRARAVARGCGNLGLDLGSLRTLARPARSAGCPWHQQHATLEQALGRLPCLPGRYVCTKFRDTHRRRGRTAPDCVTLETV